MLSLSGMRPTEPSAHGLYRDCGIMTLRSSMCYSLLPLFSDVCIDVLVFGVEVLYAGCVISLVGGGLLSH